jgi:hypothetical protein
LAATQILDLAEEASRLAAPASASAPPPEKPRQDPHRQEEAGLAAHPARAAE